MNVQQVIDTNMILISKKLVDINQFKYKRFRMNENFSEFDKLNI